VEEEEEEAPAQSDAQDVIAELMALMVELRAMAADPAASQGFKQTIGMVSAAWEATNHRHHSGVTTGCTYAWEVDNHSYVRLFVHTARTQSRSLIENACRQALDHVITSDQQLLERCNQAIRRGRREVSGEGLRLALSALYVVRDLVHELQD
jgi:hypothetical protein